MYSHWLSMISPNGCQAPVPYYHSENLMPPPDVVLEIGSSPINTRFWVHSQVIGQYSGYLRSAVTTAQTPSTHQTLYGLPDKPIYIPNISVEQFQPLLRYMYSGFLDLNMENILAVLLATHVLHMPHALEICRSFISRMQLQGIMPTPCNIDSATSSMSAQTPSTKQLVLKPIPNKAKQGFLLENNFSAPVAPHILVPSSDSTFQTLCSWKDSTAAQPSEPVKFVEQNSEYNNQTKVVVEQQESLTTEPNLVGKAILDIASCDGPVRFRRVVNKYYKSVGDPYRPTVLDGNTSERIQQLTSSSFHQQMVRDINERRLCDESQTSTSQDTDQPHSFKCAVCKHTFKSEYCYLKHSKRHLIPLVDSGDTAPHCDNVENSEYTPSAPDDLEKGNTTGHKAKSSSGNNSQIREVIRPLDMNVQYYPCKTCGSKFPSYYFVHKHRKMCHQQMDTDNERKSEEANETPITLLNSISSNIGPDDGQE